MSENQETTAVHDVHVSYSAENDSMSTDERAWIEQAIDEGLASPRITDRNAREIMAEIKTKNRGE